MKNYSTIEFEKTVLSAFNQSKSMKNVWKLLGCSNMVIHRILKKYNIRIPKRGSFKRIVKVNPFKQGDPISEYWQGFLAADGNIYKNFISLELQESDKYHVIKFSNFVGGTVVRSRIRKQFNKKQYSTAFGSIDTALYLRSLGITSNKSHSLKYLFPLNWDFVRGYFDGDGCICIRSTGYAPQAIFYSGSLDFITQIKEFLSLEGINLQIKCYDKRTSSNFYSLWITSKSNLILLYNKMYDNDGENLSRKKEKFKKIIDDIKIRSKRGSECVL